MASYGKLEPPKEGRRIEIGGRRSGSSMPR